jgi:hypothetical protein
MNETKLDIKLGSAIKKNHASGRKTPNVFFQRFLIKFVGVFCVVSPYLKLTTGLCWVPST